MVSFRYQLLMLSDRGAAASIRSSRRTSLTLEKYGRINSLWPTLKQSMALSIQDLSTALSRQALSTTDSIPVTGPSRTPISEQSSYMLACGLKGHRRPECTNPPRAVGVQRRLYEGIMFDKDYAWQPRSDSYEREDQSGQCPNLQYQDQSSQ